MSSAPARDAAAKPSGPVTPLFANQAKTMSSHEIGVPSDHTAFGLIVYLTVRGSSAVFSYVPRSVVGRTSPRGPNCQKPLSTPLRTARFAAVAPAGVLRL